MPGDEATPPALDLNVPLAILTLYLLRLGVDAGAAGRAYCRQMSSHLERASGKSRLGSRRKGRPATVVACERRDPI
jgi:hypothetical protein